MLSKLENSHTQLNSLLRASFWNYNELVVIMQLLL